jgi:hypothetical protein
MNKKICLLGGFLIFLPVVIYAATYWGGELPNISNTQLKAKVTFAEEGIYTYSYTIVSGSGNTGDILSLDIDIKQPQGGAELNREGIINGPHYLQHTSDQILSASATPRMVPVGLWSPRDWISGLNVFGEVGWGGALLKPGLTLDGFQMTSRGSPGIRDFRIEPRLVPPSGGDTDEPPLATTPNEILAKIKTVKDNVAFKGKTVGPTAPPTDLRPMEFLDYIIDLKHQSTTYGWITNQGIEQSLDAKLENAKKKLEPGDTETAKNILNAFVNEVEA